ncbi:LCP family protein [Labedaea rhizosphaerae]|uniref:LytR family transcriptional attenuator n=1 Tax=Labedaea rhizosphaerae TaxID=598644 RepID=A0A4R6S3N2_LABRH|nr:LCP family protein [Labedaea rhizosphaerae]TDP93687.1 LytR family transcriptional attenuator [Labedaea rhizosphaerae]
MSERAPEDERSPDEVGATTEPALTPASVPVPRRRSPVVRVGLNSSRSLFALVSAAVLATTGYYWWNVGNPNDNVVTTDVIDQQGIDTPQGKPLDGAVDMLLVGMDSRTDAYGNPLPDDEMAYLHAGISDGERNTDTMILVHIPIDGTRATAISFPRDSWVEQAGPYGKHKLNSAFVYAYNDTRKTLINKGDTDEKDVDKKATIAGRKNLIKTIEKLTGGTVSIDKYAEVNLASFYEITKAIGGVQVCLKKPVNDVKSGAHFKAGVQTVSGASALSFVRQRYGLPNGDLDRIVRQQVFLGALANKVLSASMLTDAGKLHELLEAVKRSVVLSSNWDLLTFAQQMQGLSSGNIRFTTIPTLGNAVIGGADVIRVDPDAVKAFVGSITADERGQPHTTTSGSSSVTTTGSPTSKTNTTAPVEPAGQDQATVAVGQITVDVRNGSDQHGLAAKISGELTTLGFQQGLIGDAPVQPKTVVEYAPGDEQAGRQVVTELGGTASLKVNSSLISGHVRVILGKDHEDGRSGLTGPVNLRKAPTPGDTTTTSTNAPTDSIQAGALTCVN